MRHVPRVIVVGGGVIGVSCAYMLGKRGARVTLLERDRLAAGASSGNAGTVSAGHPPLNRPGRVRQALLQMFDRTGPLYVPPRWDPSLWRWLRRFSRHCTHKHVKAAMSVLAPLGQEALRLFDELVEQESLDCGYTREGYYDICRTARGFLAAQSEAQIIRVHGYHPEVLSGEALREREPALALDVLGGVHYPEAATLEPLRFVNELADRARKCGVQMREGVDVREVRVAFGRAAGVRVASGAQLDADAVVLATGPYSLSLAERLGTELPIAPGKGYHRDVPVGGTGAPRMRIACVLHESSVFCTPMGDRLRLAGTLEFSGLNDDMHEHRLEQLTKAARECIPALGEAPPLSEWCGSRPMSADGLPIVGPLPGVEGVLVANGHGKLGLTLGPVTGRVVADYLLGGSGETLYPALSPARLAG